ncbi:mannose-1-phosphate guanylyltransferase/mannose-6-phosphate isomerase [Betaproteobacteria bacterium LSUCC0117]|nr:mannose-1-phosphate guanylyltransferase/mannose-6-phosphate isomerase [Betaproteobacteria bacterium LSUCC0117]
MKNEKILFVQPVVLCGGVGSRLWPLSRLDLPKQFHIFNDEFSLFQGVIKRLLNIKDEQLSISDPIIVAGEENRFHITEQLSQLLKDDADIILEPEQKNTAPAMTLAALTAQESGQDPILLVSPADQSIGDVEGYELILKNAINIASENHVVLLGVKPTHPETGYGYIETGATYRSNARKVKCFIEKPDIEKAVFYANAENFYWNSGVFIVKASVWLKLMKKYQPEMLNVVNTAWQNKKRDNNFIRPDKSAYTTISPLSVDHAVIERCPGETPVYMIPVDVGWSDVGAWDAVWNINKKDISGNACVGDVLALKSLNNYLHSTSRLVAVLGVEDLVVVETPDAVLITKRQSSQEVRQIVASLNQIGRSELAFHRKVNRPWGWYDTIDEGSNFKVKRISVKPQGSLSLQQHAHRAEHWVVVSGVAEVIVGDETIILRENQSTYIPLGKKHRLKNPSNKPLEIIEVQSGEYLGEDDIIRFEDKYGRE